MPVSYFLVGPLLHLLGLRSLIVSQQPQKTAPKNREALSIEHVDRFIPQLAHVTEV